MSELQVSRRSLKKPTIGDMRERIELFNRGITSPTFNSAKFTEKYTLVREIWSRVITLNPAATTTFSGIDITNSPTHIFTVRYFEDITTEMRIKWKNKYYEITKALNPEERNDFLWLYSEALGSADLQANR